MRPLWGTEEEGGEMELSFLALALGGYRAVGSSSTCIFHNQEASVVVLTYV